MDKILRNKKLEDFHSWLRDNFEGEYIALCEAGSTTAGDPWVEGRSDRDITIVFKGLEDAHEAEIRNYLRDKFNDTYLFIIFDEEFFLKTSSEQDLSHMFRGEVLFGQDIYVNKDVPTREFAGNIAKSGLIGVERQLRTRLMNSKYWTLEHLRNYVYPLFKKLIMYLAAKKYSETGIYPRTRLNTAEAYGSKNIQLIAEAIQNINSISKRDLVYVIKKAISVARDNM